MILVGPSTSSHASRRPGASLTALELVANRPIVHHVLDRLDCDSDAGFILAGDAESLLDVRAGLREYGPVARVEYVVADCRGVVGALGAVAPHVGDAACLVQPADGLLDCPVSPLLRMIGDDRSNVLLLSSTRRDSTDLLGHMHARPDYAAGWGSVVEAALFAPGTLARAGASGTEGGQDLDSVGRRLAESGVIVRREPIDGWHRYSGAGTDLLELNRVVLDRLVRSVPADMLAGNQIEGKAVIDSTAEVRSSTIVGPTVIGPRAVVTDAYVGPYTSIGAAARISGAEIERSIVSPGASVMNVGSRLTSSLVGRGSRVFRDFSLPRAVRLWVGEGDEVALC